MKNAPKDPLSSDQWHLQNNAPDSLDLNLIDVWQDYTGAGVEVAVIDDGVQGTHPDLVGNYSTYKDWDFKDNDTNASGFDNDNHGTAVAGIISAEEGNGIGGVGVAYDSTAFGFRIDRFISNRLIQQLTEAIDNASGQQQTSGTNRKADIVNMSIGTMFEGNYFDQYLDSSDMRALNAAIDKSVELGRNGLGTILVKSGGNSRIVDGTFGPVDINQDTNTSSWNANPHTISIAAINKDGFVSSYSTHGASLLVSAFGTGGIDIPGEVVTTDRVGNEGYDSSEDYTHRFNGTSAAAPMVSGVVALMLEANPNLGWRDVQEILAYSARHVGTDVGAGTSGFEEYAWTFNGADNWNGGGLHFSNDYGFGLVDAKAAVRLAETWGSTPKTSANDIAVSADFLDVSTTIRRGNDGSGGTEFNQSVLNNLEIEHVAVDIHFKQWCDLGDLELRLISPNGTTSVLIDNSGENSGSSLGGFGSGRWKFFSNAFRGENTLGDWKVQLFDTDNIKASPVTIDDLDITFYGQTVSNNDTFIFTEEYSDYAGQFGHRRSFNGRSGTDTINAAAVDSNTTLNLDTGTGSIDGVSISLSSIENVIAGDGSDLLVGSISRNKLLGMRGNDRIHGNDGNDSLYGGSGNDHLDGGQGADELIGGLGADIFGYKATQDFGDTIDDFEVSRDRIDLSGTLGFSFDALSFEQDSNDTLLNILSGDNTSRTIATLKNVDASQLNRDHFILNGYTSVGIVGNSIRPTTLSWEQADDYLASNPDLIQVFGYNLTAAQQHYENWGYSEGRQIDTFAEGLYLASNADLIDVLGYNLDAATAHYINYGLREGRNAISFVPERYLGSYSDLGDVLGNNRVAATRHYIEFGYREGRDPLLGVDGEAYIANLGHEQGLEMTFNPREYLASNPDLIPLFQSDLEEATEHYVTYGALEGRSTGSFDGDAYLNRYADLQAAFGGDIEAATQHYLSRGFFEGRIGVSS